MKLELLYFDDCPNWKVAAERLDGLATPRGLTVERRLVTTAEQAETATIEQLEAAIDPSMTGTESRARGPGAGG